MRSRHRPIALLVVAAQLLAPGREALAQAVQAAASARGTAVPAVTVQPTIAPVQTANLLTAPVSLGSQGISPAPAVALELGAQVQAAAGGIAAGRAQAGTLALPVATALSPKAVPGELARSISPRAVEKAPAAEAFSLAAQAAPAAPKAAPRGATAAFLTRIFSPRLDPKVVFDGAASRLAEPEAKPALDPSRITVFITRHGAAPEKVSLAELRERLASEPELAGELNAKGRVRVVVNSDVPGALPRERAGELEAVLKSEGVSASVAVEKIPIDWARRPGGTGEAGRTGDKAEAGWSLKRFVTAPFRELGYIGRTLAAAYEKPTFSELLGGLATKGPALALSIMWWGLQLLPQSPIKFDHTPGLGELVQAFQMVWAAPWAHPWVFAAVIALSATQDFFHAIWIATWQNFQNIIERQRGLPYQNVFNFLYMQLGGAVYRALAWLAIAGIAAPWTLRYLGEMGLVTLVGATVGTFAGTLGFFGLNALYRKGRIQRGARSGIQQVRDLSFLFGGLFFGSGSLVAFWILFIVQQSLDLGLYALGRRAQARPILYVADRDIAATPEFSRMYPVTPGPEESPVKTAGKAVLNNPVVRGLRALWAKLTRRNA